MVKVLPATVSADGRPTGREAVRQAVLEAAVRLFADLGPSSVSLRDIAAAANVNLGLLHRHFGSKSDLVSAALRQVAAETGPALAETIAGPELAQRAASFAVSPPQAYVRMLAWSLIDGADPRVLQEGFPVASALVQRFRAEGLDDAQARVTAAAAMALALGWALFEPHLAVAAQLDTTRRDELESELAALMGRLVGDQTGVLARK